ncbi:MAG: ATP-binding protein [Breznakia sp.]
MRKEQFAYKPSDTMEQERKELVKQLLKLTTIQTFLRRFSLNEQFVKDNAYQLKEYSKKQHLCKGCLGLGYCKQERTGYLLSPHYDDDLTFSYLPCKFKEEEHHKVAHQHYIILNHLSLQQMQTSLKTTKIDCDNKYFVMIMDALNEILKQKKAQGLYLYGEPGVGKTYLLSAFANDYARNAKKVAFVHVPTMIADLKMMMQDNRAFRRYVHTLRTIDCLILDDIGGESASSWSRDDILLPILNERMEHHRQSFFTSNYSIANLEKFYALKSKQVNDITGAKRLVERIRAISKQFQLKGMNRRVKTVEIDCG